MTTVGRRFHPANSKTGRQIMSASSATVSGPGITPEQRKWNLEVEERKALKKAARENREVKK